MVGSRICLPVWVRELRHKTAEKTHLPNEDEIKWRTDVKWKKNTAKVKWTSTVDEENDDGDVDDDEKTHT